ncbi:MAG: tetratricopeptide repeat protein [Gemmatimonadota bacterium]|nr:tetratricopeptide repeat protein [Gemmatimonadota bacterium]
MSLRSSVWVGVALVSLLATRLHAQAATGDSAWAAGEYYRARLAYQKALEDDPRNAQALFRLGILASWDGLLDSSLTLLARARTAEPRDPEIRLHQAKVLSWAGRYGEAVAQYDSLLAEQPDNQEAALGRARTLSWSGRLTEADDSYATMLARDPSNVEALAGRGQVALWSGDRDAAAPWYERALELDPKHVISLIGMAQVRQGQTRPDEATEYINQALALAPTDRDAQRIATEIRALRRVRLDAVLGWSRDSDENILWWQTVGASYIPYPGLRAFSSVGIAEASDPFRHANRFAVEAGAAYGIRQFTATAAIGLRSLSSDTDEDHLPATWRLYGGYRLSRTANVGAGYAHYAFDETALLISQGLMVDELSGDGSVILRPKLSLSGNAAAAFFDDGNRRLSASATLMQGIANNYSAGLYGRLMGYKQDGFGYFTPDLFYVTEARGTYWRAMGLWNVRLAGGLGIQQAGSDASAQFEYNFEARLARQWGAINEVALLGALSNSALSSTTGAFRYYTALLTARIGL